MSNLDALSAIPTGVDECAAKETWVKPIAVSAKVQDVTELDTMTGSVFDVDGCSS